MDTTLHRPALFHDRNTMYTFNKGISAKYSEEAGWLCKVKKREDTITKQEEHINALEESSFNKIQTSSRSVQFPLEWFDYVEAFSMIAIPNLRNETKAEGLSKEVCKMLSEIDCEDLIRNIFSKIPGSIEWVVGKSIEIPVCTLNLQSIYTFDYETKLAEGIEAARMWYLLGKDKNVNYAFMGKRCTEIDDYKWEKTSFEKFKGEYLQCESCGWLVKSTELIKCRAEIAHEEFEKNDWRSCCRFSCIYCTKKVHGSYVSVKCSALCDMCLENYEVRKLTKLCDDKRWCDDCLRDGDSLSNHRSNYKKKNVLRCDGCRRRRLFFSKRKMQ